LQKNIFMTISSKNSQTDILLIGAGIMSATLATMLKELEPNLNIEIFERLDVAAAESSDAWNNAGTGHSAFCELNYTPENENGAIETKKAIEIAEQFELSRQFWSFLVQNKTIATPKDFIKSIPHISFVWGESNVNFLHKRWEALSKNVLFAGMEFSVNASKIKEWIPLVMKNRPESDKIAATLMNKGTDVNFGSLTRTMFDALQKQNDVTLHFHHEVKKLKKQMDNSWLVKVKDLDTGESRKINAKFVFIGAGGGSLYLLEKADIPEGKGFGGFPVSGQWLRCNNPEVIKEHHAKVYGKAAVGSPPMSVPHIDTRVINGKQELLFGPYAGFSTKFLKNGSYLDLVKSIQSDNILPMLSAGFKNIPLTKYLIEQVRQSPKDRLEALKEYVPTAKLSDWELEIAGQRVQVIKKDENGGGVLEFGTEVVNAADGSLACLLGASPGASTAVAIMLELFEKCFPKKLATSEWQSKLKEMIPSYGQKLNENPELSKQIREFTSKTLQLEF
jgi:malate dehydrogenase (quinone)